MDEIAIDETLNDLAPEEVALIQAYRRSSELDRKTITTLLSLVLKSLIEPFVPNNVIELSSRFGESKSPLSVPL
jgi:hypothetical protein